jgi:hypothetical protein
MTVVEIRPRTKKQTLIHQPLALLVSAMVSLRGVCVSLESDETEG